MKEIIEFLNDNNGALMVVITLVYVVATVLICVFNYKSSKAATSQLEESKRQFDETTRLNHLPVLTVSTTKGIRNVSISINPDLPQVVTRINLLNIGHCTAQLVEGYFDFGYGNEQYEEICRYLAVGEATDYSFASFYSKETMNKSDFNSDVTLHLRFNDLLGNKYKQQVLFVLANNGKSIVVSSCSIGEVILIGKTK